MYLDSNRIEELPLALGQQTNSTPENISMPQGRSMAKLCWLIWRFLQAVIDVRFHSLKLMHWLEL